MTSFQTKLRLIFKPFLFVSTCSIIVYTFLNWLLVINLHVIKMEDDTINLIIPVVLLWVPLLIWVRPLIKLLKLKTSGRNDPVFAMLILLWVVVGVPLVISQEYMDTATGKLTRLTALSEIIRFPETKYYIAKRYYVNKRLVHVKTYFSVSGKGNNNFDMNIYASVPVFDHIYPDTNLIAILLNSINPKALVIVNNKLSNIQEVKKYPADSIRAMRIVNPTMVMPHYGDTGKYGALAVMTYGYKLKRKSPPQKISPVAWLAVKYHKTISNSLSPSEKMQRFKEFGIQCDTDYKYKKLDGFVYLQRISSYKERSRYKAAIKLKDDVVGEDPVILSPIFDSFENRNGNKIYWIIGSFTIGSVIFLLILAAVKLKPEVCNDGDI